MTAQLHSVAGVMAGLISVVGFLPYALAIVRRQTQPSHATWLIWSVVGGLLFVSYDAAVGGAARWVPFTDALAPALIAALSLLYRSSGFTRFDLWCLGLAALSVAGWVYTGSPMVTHGINLLLALLGALPTIRNVYRDATCEPVFAWRMFFLGNALNLFAIETWSVQSAAYPIYAVAVSGLLNVLLCSRVRALYPPLFTCEPGSSFSPQRLATSKEVVTL